MLITDEVYGASMKALGGHGCPWGWVRIVDIKNPVKPKVIVRVQAAAERRDRSARRMRAHPTTSFAAHNPTLTKNLAFITWHSGGLQVVDISNPRQARRRSPSSLPTPVIPILQEDPVLSSGGDKVVAWSYPIIKDGLIYFVDVRNGLYVMRYKGPLRQGESTRPTSSRATRTSATRSSSSR